MFLPQSEKYLKIAFDHSNDHRQQKFRIPQKQISGYSEAGIAPGLGPGDRAFESHYSDQKHAEIVDFSVFFCIKILIFGVVKAAFGVCFDHIYFFDYCGAEFDYMSI